jgi:hypothetical protein
MTDYNIQITSTDKIFITKFSDLEIIYKPQIPFYQRSFIDERVLYFYNKIKNSKEVPFLSMLYFGNFEGKNYLLDGQHRYLAYKNFYKNNNNQNFNVCFTIKKCDTLDTLKQYFRDLNNNYLLHDLIINDDDLDKSNEIKKYMNENYKSCISQAESPKFPNINLDQLCNYLLKTFTTISGDEICDKIEYLNLCVGDLLQETDIDLYNKGTNKNKFYLGFIFIKKNIKHTIPAKIRYTLWKSTFPDISKGNCYVCNCDVEFDNFHASHIISVKHGGTDKLQNLKICCSVCNLSMGSKNLEDFKNNFF